MSVHRDQVQHRFYWTKLSFGISAFLVCVASLFDWLGVSETIFYFSLPVVVSIAFLALSFGAFVRALGESATTWIATIVFLPFVGWWMAYAVLRPKYNRAVGGVGDRS
jgi:hypothetical protein